LQLFYDDFADYARLFHGVGTRKWECAESNSRPNHGGMTG
jgi:hypothetical protein